MTRCTSFWSTFRSGLYAIVENHGNLFWSKSKLCPISMLSNKNIKISKFPITTDCGAIFRYFFPVWLMLLSMKMMRNWWVKESNQSTTFGSNDLNARIKDPKMRTFPIASNDMRIIKMTFKTELRLWKLNAPTWTSNDEWWWDRDQSLAKSKHSAKLVQQQPSRTPLAFPYE